MGSSSMPGTSVGTGFVRMKTKEEIQLNNKVRRVFLGTCRMQWEPTTRIPNLT